MRPPGVWFCFVITYGLALVSEDESQGCWMVLGTSGSSSCQLWMANYCPSKNHSRRQDDRAVRATELQCTVRQTTSYDLLKCRTGTYRRAAFGRKWQMEWGGWPRALTDTDGPIKYRHTGHHRQKAAHTLTDSSQMFSYKMSVLSWPCGAWD